METKQILETIRMVEEENLDIRTITMGISLLDCIDASTEKTCQNIYNKITSKAKNLVKVGDEIASEFAAGKTVLLLREFWTKPQKRWGSILSAGIAH